VRPRPRRSTSGWPGISHSHDEEVLGSFDGVDRAQVDEELLVGAASCTARTKAHRFGRKAGADDRSCVTRSYGLSR